MVEPVVVPEFLDEPPPQLTTSSNEGNKRRVIRASTNFNSPVTDRYLDRKVMKNSDSVSSGGTVMNGFDSYDAEGRETCCPRWEEIFALILQAGPIFRDKYFECRLLSGYGQ